MAGFLPRDAAYEKLISNGIVKTPVLVIMGENDAFVPPARSQQLVNALQGTCQDTQYFVHAGAHMVPTCSGECKQEVCAFIDKHKSPNIGES